ncbi:MAG TPA: alpha-amylase family glycosyl hydrolase, partial [Burkholderiaceae bacterium]|nr:alpha-amylase family glycosyl hydrolase [Burkholderiaceae bacterium]
MTFAVWAPRCASLAVRLFGAGGVTRAELPMQAGPAGVHTARAAAGVAAPGDDYAFVLPGVGTRPDPVSRLQPAGVHGPSRIVAPGAFAWSDAAWTGLPRGELVFYELHVGTFTPEGTFAGVARMLPHLRELGVTAVELMPVVAFPGDRNWGYDGVFPYAPHAAYGGPEALKALVDACHAQGLALFLDVVYNHLGPEGNYLREFGPYFTDHYQTPWGRAFNYDGRGSDAVRAFALDNVRLWLDEFHCDGLRLDAVHAIYDLGARHLLAAARAVADEISRARHRPVHLVAESDLNDPRLLLPPQRGGCGLDAQWSDDFHHAVHSFLTTERSGYYEDFGQADQLARVLERP